MLSLEFGASASVTSTPLSEWASDKTQVTCVKR